MALFYQTPQSRAIAGQGRRGIWYNIRRMRKAWSILPEEWKPILAERGLRPFRADQILHSLYRDWIDDWDMATTLPRDFRETLKAEFPITKTETLDVSQSSDGTRKLLLGYEDGEIARLYLVTTGLVVLIASLGSMFIGYEAMKFFWDIMLRQLGGYFAFIMKPEGFVQEFVLVMTAYVLITVFDWFRIRHIPKVLALKNAE